MLLTKTLVGLSSLMLVATPLLAKEDLHCKRPAAVRVANLIGNVQQAALQGDFKVAENAMVELETAWIIAESDLRPIDEAHWKATDTAVFNAVALLQRARPEREQALQAVQSLQAAFIAFCRI